jgi:hypothetical protein
MMAGAPRSILALGALLAGPGPAAVAQAAPEYQAKIALMDKLTRFVDWPQGAIQGRAFVLGVLGRTPFGDELDAYFTARTLKDHPVQVRTLRQASDLAECDLLFICASERPRLAAILAQVKGRPVLTVADCDGFVRAGVMVAMVRSGDRVGFEVNLAPVRDAGLRMAPGFLQLARLVP